MTKVWDACDGGVWSISSKDHLSFDLKGAGTQDAWCLMGQAIGQEGERRGWKFNCRLLNDAPNVRRYCFLP